LVRLGCDSVKSLHVVSVHTVHCTKGFF